MSEANQANWDALDTAAARSIGDRSDRTKERTLTSAHGDEHGPRWAWAHVALGSAGIVAVSLFYVLSPAAAVIPALGADLAPARAAALTDAGFMRLAGATGVLSDLLAAAGALGLAQAASKKRGERQAIGFYWLACSALIFTLVDALVGFSLRASAAAGLATFAVIKPLFDVLTAAGSFAYGAGSLLIAWPSSDGIAIGPRRLALAVIVVGALLAVAGPASAWGLAAGQLIGLGLTLQTVLLTVVAARNALASSP